MKKFKFLALALLLMSFGATSLHAQDKVVAIDHTGVHELKVIKAKIDDSTYVTQYDFWKICYDTVGCPYEISGKINGFDFVTYRQRYNWDQSQAYYDGFIYDY